MGSYAYCNHPDCECGLDRPTLSEIASDNWCCGNGHRNELREDRVTLLAEWAERQTDREIHIPAGHPDFKVRCGDILELSNSAHVMVTVLNPNTGRFGAIGKNGWLNWTQAGEIMHDKSATLNVKAIIGGVCR